jgi:hypothetical protein
MMTQQGPQRNPDPGNERGSTGGGTKSTSPATTPAAAIPQPTGLEGLSGRGPGKTGAVNKDSETPVKKEGPRTANGQALKIPTVTEKITELALDYIRPLRDVWALVADVCRKPGDVKSTGGYINYLNTLKYDLYAIAAGTAMAGLIGGGAFVVSAAMPTWLCVSATLVVGGWAYRQFSKGVRNQMANSLGPEKMKKTHCGRNIPELIPQEDTEATKETKRGGARRGPGHRTSEYSAPKSDQEIGANSIGSGALGLNAQGTGGAGGGLPKL